MTALRDQICDLFAALNAADDSAAATARQDLVDLLRANRKGFSDLADLTLAASVRLWPSDGGTRERLAKLIALLGSPMAGERNSSRMKIITILAKHKRDWGDLVELLRAADYADWPDQEADLGAPVNLLDLLYHLIEGYAALEPHEITTVAAWILHTHVFGRFMVTPRLALTSPVRGCGKTTLLDVISRLAANPSRVDSVTAAALYYDTTALTTWLLDEADNLRIDGVLGAVLNSGHRRGGCVKRHIGGRGRSFPTFSPAALATIGLELPLPLQQRSIIIRMQRHDGARKLRRYDAEVPDFALNEAYRRIVAWAREVKLDPDPELPAALQNRQADNWRPLISIADACGDTSDWRMSVRDAAVIFARQQPDEDMAVVALYHIRDIFAERGADRIASAALVEALVGIDDAPWSEWRGVNGDQHPRKITQAQLAMLLRPFGIRPRVVWPLNRGAETKSAKGYMRAWFEAAWARYCGDDGAPSQAGASVRQLRGAS
jgi:hypothetical protein